MSDLEADITKLTKEIRDLGEDGGDRCRSGHRNRRASSGGGRKRREKSRIHRVHRTPWADVKSLLTEFLKKAGQTPAFSQQEPAADAPATWHKEDGAEPWDTWT